MDPVTFERSKQPALVAVFGFLFIGGNVAWTCFAQSFLNHKHIHCPLFLLLMSTCWSMPVGVALLASTKKAWIPRGHFLEISFGSWQDLLKYSPVTFLMTLRVAAQLHSQMYNSVLFICSSLVFLPVLVMPLDLAMFPRGFSFSRAKACSGLIAICTGAILVHTAKSNITGRMWIAAQMALLICEHSAEHYLQFQRPIGTSDAAMTLIRNWTMFGLTLPFMYFSHKGHRELDVVQQLPRREILRIMVASFSVAMIAFGMTGLTARIHLTAYFFVKALIQLLNLVAAQVYLGEGCTHLQYCCAVAMLTSIIIFSLPGDENVTVLKETTEHLGGDAENQRVLDRDPSSGSDSAGPDFYGTTALDSRRPSVISCVSLAQSPAIVLAFPNSIEC